MPNHEFHQTSLPRGFATPAGPRVNASVMAMARKDERGDIKLCGDAVFSSTNKEN